VGFILGASEVTGLSAIAFVRCTFPGPSERRPEAHNPGWLVTHMEDRQAEQTVRAIEADVCENLRENACAET
jgi:hypothetical protein